MRSYPIKDCDCEDFPCCEHADNFPSDHSSYYCDVCGFHHAGDCSDEEDISWEER